MNFVWRSESDQRAVDGRRPAGDLEAAVLGVLWASQQPMVPADVLAELDNDLAYSTVLTILVRLHRKGTIQRTRHGRAHAYSPLIAEADVVTGQVRRMLRDATDRNTVVHAFLAGLEPGDEALLRELLARTSPEND